MIGRTSSWLASRRLFSVSRRALLIAIVVGITVGLIMPGIAMKVTAPAPSVAGCFGFVYHPRFDGTNGIDHSILDYLLSKRIATISVDIRWDAVQLTEASTPDYSVYDAFFNLAKAHSIKIIPLLAIHCTPDWVFDVSYPESEQVNNKGVSIREATKDASGVPYRDPAIATSPFALGHEGVRALASTFIQTTVTRYMGHSAFGGAWILANEPIFPVTVSDTKNDPTVFYDYSPRTVEMFREYVFHQVNGESATYSGSESTGLTELAVRWSFSSSPWSIWDDVEAPPGLGYEDPEWATLGITRDTTKDRYWLDWMEFRESYLADFVKWNSEVVDAVDSTSKIVLKTNSWDPLKPTGAQAGFNYYTVFKTAPLVDVYALDFYPDDYPSDNAYVVNDRKSLTRENEFVMHLSVMRGLIIDNEKELWIGELGERRFDRSPTAPMGTDMSAATVLRMTALALTNGANKVFFYCIDPDDVDYSFYYNLVPSEAMTQVISMNTGIDNPDIKKMLSVAIRLKPQVAVVLGMADVYQTAYWWNTAVSPAAWDWPYREALSKHVVCQALQMASIPYVLLYENYIRERGVPAYVNALYMPGMWRISAASAVALKTFVDQGNYIWGDLRAGEFLIEEQVLKSGDVNFQMNAIFGATYGELVRDVNEFDDRVIKLMTGMATEHLPRGTYFYGTHDENAVAISGVTLEYLAGFLDDPGTLAIWLNGKAERVASNISVRQYQRVEANEHLNTEFDVTTFRTYITDFALFARGMCLWSPQGPAVQSTVSTWDEAYINSKTATCAEYFLESSLGGTTTVSLEHLNPVTSYKVTCAFTTGTGAMTVTATSTSDGLLTVSFTLSADMVYFCIVKKA